MTNEKLEELIDALMLVAYPEEALASTEPYVSNNRIAFRDAIVHVLGPARQRRKRGEPAPHRLTRHPQSDSTT